MTERSEEEVVSGLLRVTVGGVVKTMPTLKARWVPTWGELLATVEDGGKPIADWTVPDSGQFGGETVKRLVDLVVAYDRTAALGGREWLEENADPAELHGALVAMAGNAFPLADAATLVNLALAASGAASVRPSSPNGASTNGASHRPRSAVGSTRSR